MYFKQILNEQIGCASYLIASRQSQEAVVVDPSIHLDEYRALLEHRRFQLRYVIDTHVHADHISGARALASEFGAELCLHESANVSYPFHPLKDGEDLQLGQLRLRVLHTPGHRPELMSLLIINTTRCPEPSMVLTADCLLVGDMGRPDFGGGDAQAQFESLGRLLRLPDWVAVFPGHFEGPCGKGMCGRPSTTIGFERLYNPLARASREEFISILAAGVPARPLNITAIEATNRGAADLPWAMLTTQGRPHEMTVEELDRARADSVVLDVREPEEYAHGHVPGAINLPQADLATRRDEIPGDRRLLVICQGGFRSLRAAQFLMQIGFENVSTVKGGTEGWREAGKSLAYGDISLEKPRVAESQWTHAGALSTTI